MSKPLFSIITVTYNAEQTILPTLKSVCSQTCTDYEHLVVDGASADNTLSVVEKFGTSRLRVVSEPDNGLYDAMNKAITVACGDYLIFLNAGDSFFEPETLQLLKQRLAAEKFPDIIYGETALCDMEGNFIGMRRLKAPEKLTWKSFKNGMLVCHQAFIVKREIAQPYDLAYRFSADFDWCIRCMKQAKSICNSRLVIVRYLSEGLTTQNHAASLKERYRIMCRYYGCIAVSLLHLWFAVRFYYAKWVVGRV